MPVEKRDHRGIISNSSNYLEVDSLHLHFQYICNKIGNVMRQCLGYRMDKQQKVVNISQWRAMPYVK